MRRQNIVAKGYEGENLACLIATRKHMDEGQSTSFKSMLPMTCAPCIVMNPLWTKGRYDPDTSQ